MKILVDMNLSPRWCHTLSAAGFECEHWRDVGPPDASDRAIMDHARGSGDVVLTSDLDFPTILWHTQAAKPSVVLLRSESTLPSVIGPSVIAALNAHTQELLQGGLLIVDASRNRVRLLPLN